MKDPPLSEDCILAREGIGGVGSEGGGLGLDKLSEDSVLDAADPPSWVHVLK